jgi:hypothetical protein
MTDFNLLFLVALSTLILGYIKRDSSLRYHFESMNEPLFALNYNYEEVRQVHKIRSRPTSSKHSILPWKLKRPRFGPNFAAHETQNFCKQCT